MGPLEKISILENGKHQRSYGSANVPITNAKNNPFEKNASHLHGSTNSNGLPPIRNCQLTYPKAVIFILLSKFFEAFAVNGVRTVLALFLRDALNFSEESSTSFYHIFNFFSQFCTIFGAILADGYLGNVKTIFYTFFIYAIGWIGIMILTLPLQHVSITPLVITSLILISFGNGCIRACVTSLGGAQFVVPEQTKELDRFFSHYYFIYASGMMLSKLIPPEIRAHTHCFGKNECYAAVFGTLGLTFFLAWIVFMMGMFLYKQEQIDDSNGNVMFQVIGCIYHGIKRRSKGHYIEAVSNNVWIDGSAGKYSDNFIHDVAAFLKVLKLFTPLPFYWALYSQIDSSWTFQASQLNTTVLGYTIEADQAKAFGALLLLIMIPLWQLLSKFHIQLAPLKSILIGGLCAALSFVCAGILQIEIEDLIHQNNDAKLSILWQFPQFILMMLGEVWLSIPGLTFSFTQAPSSMKSIITAAWFCNSAFGNLIVVAITEMHLFKFASSGYFLYSALMFAAMLVFNWIAKTYTVYVTPTTEQTYGNLNKIPYATIQSQDALDLII